MPIRSVPALALVLLAGALVLGSPASASAPSPLPREAQRYAWADGSGTLLTNGASLSVLTGIDAADALHAVAPRAVSPVLSPAAADALAARLNSAATAGTYYEVVYAAARGRRTLVLEDNGFLVTDHAVSRALSARGRAASVYVDIERDADYLYSVRGRLLRAFDPLLGSCEVGPPLPQEAGLPFGSEPAVPHFLALSLVLTARLTGYAARPSDLAPWSYTDAVVVRY